MSLFSKPQYVWLASFFRDELKTARQIDENCDDALSDEEDSIRALIERLGTELEQTNPTFDKSRFLKTIYFKTSEPV